MFTEDKMTAVSVSYMQASLRIIKNKNACERMHAPTHTHTHTHTDTETNKKQLEKKKKKEEEGNRKQKLQNNHRPKAVKVIMQEHCPPKIITLCNAFFKLIDLGSLH